MSESSQAALGELINGIGDFGSWNHVEKIQLFGWFLHKSKDRFKAADIRQCYDKLALERPSNIPDLLDKLTRQVPKKVMKDTRGYYLLKPARDGLESKFGVRDITVQIARLLETLPSKIPDLAESEYLKEALICLKHGAFRAAIVMTWNLSFHHLCAHILKNHLPQFNSRWLVVYQGHHKSGKKEILKLEDFNEELKESQIIAICNSAGIITSNIHRILEAKLSRRNSAAHPSGLSISQLQAEEFVDDLIRNVVLNLT